MIQRIPKFDDGLDSVYDLALSQLMIDEGFKSNPYWDPIGKVWTSGYGFTDKKHQHAWKEADARKVLRQYIINKDKTARSNKNWGLAYSELSPLALAEIINLMFQGGDGVIDEKMPSFRKAMINRNWDEATKQLDFGISQTKTRSKNRRKRFGDAIAAMRLQRPEEDNAVTTYDFKSAPKYTFNKPTSEVLHNVKLHTTDNVDVPNQTPAPVHMSSNMLPNIKQLIEQQIFQPQWTVQ